jgi:phosphoglycolate phosphatase
VAEAPRQPVLVLFDVDGTLLLDDAYAHGGALVAAMRAVYGVDVPHDAVNRAQPFGKTDPRIAREVLSALGVSEQEVTAGRTAWIEAAGSAFAAEAARLSSRWRVRPALPWALEQLAAHGMRLTLLTGNLRAIAAIKMERIGLASALDLAIGAYGEDAEDRPGLVAIARRRASTSAKPWPRERTVIVGDTPLDVAAASGGGVASVVFASERFPSEALAEADGVVGSSEELVAWLLRRKRVG